MADETSTGDAARVEAAWRLVRQSDSVERLRSWGLLASMFAAASFVAVAGVAPPGWVAIPAVAAVAGGYLLVRYIRARARFRRNFADASERFTIPRAARDDLRRYFDDHRVDPGVPATRDPAVRLAGGASAALAAVLLLGVALLIRLLL